MPEVVQSKDEEIKDEDVASLLEIAGLAIDSLINFRMDEGRSLANDLANNIKQIEDLLKQALTYENERIDTVRNRLLNNLEESKQKEKVNADRFEQEMIYYLEKYDISEEKVRLKSHCDYFLKTMGIRRKPRKKTRLYFSRDR